MRERRRLENKHIGALLQLQRVTAEDEISTPTLIPSTAIEQPAHAWIRKIAAKRRHRIDGVIKEGRRRGGGRWVGAEVPVRRQVVMNVTRAGGRPLRTRSPTSTVLHAAFGVASATAAAHHEIPHHWLIQDIGAMALQPMIEPFESDTVEVAERRLKPEVDLAGPGTGDHVYKALVLPNTDLEYDRLLQAPFKFAIFETVRPRMMSVPAAHQKERNIRIVVDPLFKASCRCATEFFISEAGHQVDEPVLVIRCK